MLAIVLSCPAFAADDSDYAFKMPENRDYPVPVKSGKKVADLVPAHWQIMDQAKGDLNGDKVDDLALVVKGNLAKFKQKNTGLGTDMFDTNPRMLLVYFKNPQSNEFKLVESSNTFIQIPDAPTMDEPFDGVGINKGLLNCVFKVFYSAGSWGTSNTCYKFRYQNNHFVLVGADSTDAMRNTGETNTYSFNFLTGKMSRQTGNLFNDQKSKTIWKRIPHNQLKPLSSFKRIYEWKIDRDLYL